MIVPGKGETRIDRIIQTLGELATGGSNALGRADVTLTAGASETTVTDSLCTEGALVVFSPLTVTAASAFPFLKSTARGSFVLGHTVSDAADRVLRYEIRRP